MLELNEMQMGGIAGGVIMVGGSGCGTQTVNHVDDEGNEWDEEEAVVCADANGGDSGGGSDDGMQSVEVTGHRMTEEEKAEEDRRDRELKEALERERQLQIETIMLQNQLILKQLAENREARERKAEQDRLEKEAEEKKKHYEEVKTACLEAMKADGERAVRAEPTGDKKLEWLAYQAGRAWAALNNKSCQELATLNGK